MRKCLLFQIQYSNGNTIRGISKLKTWFNENKIDGFEEHISFLRNLQELRSAGTGHRKGKNYDKISKKFDMDEKSLIDVYEQILMQADDFIILWLILFDKLNIISNI